MTTLLALLALACKLVGVVFLFAAALGVLRFSDPFQRMHAATKAGTVGALFVVLGAVLSLHSLDAAVIGVLVIVFLLLTIPVAGHLLGRAAYLSGASLEGLEGGDALAGVLEREKAPLELRADEPATHQSERPGL